MRSKSSKTTLLLLILAISIFSSCAHNFQRIDIKKEGETVIQTLKVRSYHDGEKEKFTVYSQINRNTMHAILEGIGNFDKHIFTLEVIKDKYNFVDYVNGKTEQGYLKEFTRVPLDTKTIFNKIDIKEPQPITIVNEKENVRLEITVLEQSITR